MDNNPPRSFSLKNVLAVIAILALAAALVIVVVKNRSNTNKSTSANTALKTQVSQLQSQNTNLNTQVSKLNQTVNSLVKTNSFVDGAVCQTQQLQLAYEKPLSSAAGQRYGLFSYQNTAKTSCTVNGFPGFLALDSKGQVLPNGPVGQDTAIAAKPLSLAANGKAYFRLHYSAAGISANEKCIDASLIESTPPANTLPLLLSTSLADLCGTVSVTSLAATAAELQ